MAGPGPSSGVWKNPLPASSTVDMSIIFESLSTWLLQVAPDPSWTNVTSLTFQNGWTNFGAPYALAAYRKVGTVVQIRGEITSGTINTVVFTLPAGYRPLANLIMSTASNSLFGQIAIDTSGGVTASVGSSTAFSLNCQFDTT